MRPAGKEVGLTVCGRFPGKRNRNIFSFHQDSSEMIDLLTISSLFRDGSLFPHLSTTWRGDTHVAILARARVFYLIPLTLRKLRDYAFFFYGLQAKQQTKKENKNGERQTTDASVLVIQPSPWAFSARSILYSSVGCDVTESRLLSSQNSRGQQGKRERLGTRLAVIISTANISKP